MYVQSRRCISVSRQPLFLLEIRRKWLCPDVTHSRPIRPFYGSTSIRPANGQELAVYTSYELKLPFVHLLSNLAAVSRIEFVRCKLSIFCSMLMYPGLAVLTLTVPRWRPDRLRLHAALNSATQSDSRVWPAVLLCLFRTLVLVEPAYYNAHPSPPKISSPVPPPNTHIPSHTLNGHISFPIL